MREVIEACDDHNETFIDHELGYSFERERDPKTAGAFLNKTNATFDTGDVLAGGTKFDGNG